MAKLNMALLFEEEDLKHRKLSINAMILQTLQNNMLRLILGYKKKNHINMEHVRKKLKMFSVNQMAIYHCLLEAYNVIRKSASEQIKMNWEDKHLNKYSLRSSVKNDVKNSEKPSTKCTGFTYTGAKLFNLLPCEIKETLSPNSFKAKIKKWIWQEIPSY